MSKELNQHLEQAEGAQGEREAAITKFAETCPMTAESAAGGKPYDIELRRYYLLGWDDRAALAQPSPARCQCCGYLVTDSEHRGCLRAAYPVVVTKNDDGQIVAVTRQDAEGQVVDVIAEAQPSPKCPVCKDSGIMGHSDLCVACDTNAQSSPKCATCDGNGRIGGPSFYAPDEGGEPCPDCAQPSPAQEVVEDRETPEVVAFIHERTGAVANAEMVRTMEEGSLPSGYTIGLMTVEQHDQMALERWQYFRRKMRQMRDLSRNIAGQRNDWKAKAESAQARVTELEKQEPVGVMRASSELGVAPYADIWPWLEPGTQLYAAPVAQAGQVPKELREAVEWADHLLFECGALVQTRAPSVHVYNKAFAAIEAAKTLLAGAPAQGGE